MKKIPKATVIRINVERKVRMHFERDRYRHIKKGSTKYEKGKYENKNNVHGQGDQENFLNKHNVKGRLEKMSSRRQPWPIQLPCHSVRDPHREREKQFNHLPVCPWARSNRGAQLRAGPPDKGPQEPYALIFNTLHLITKSCQLLCHVWFKSVPSNALFPRFPQHSPACPCTSLLRAPRSSATALRTAQQIRWPVCPGKPKSRANLDTGSPCGQDHTGRQTPDLATGLRSQILSKNLLCELPFQSRNRPRC